jgi:ribonuclease P protein component
MLKSQSRLRKRADITRVYKRGSYGSGGGVLSAKALRSGHTHSRAVVVVGKKVSKKAVTRNLIRRRVVSDLEKRLETLTSGYDIVITVHQDVSELQPSQLANQLAAALTKAGAINPSSE